MSFPGTGLGEERKQLLEQLEEKKKLLRMQAQHGNQTGSSASVPSSAVISPIVSTPAVVSPISPNNNGSIPPGPLSPVVPMGMASTSPLIAGKEINPILINPLLAPLGSDICPMTPAQRTALQHAQANSVGYFIPQDSSFGNLILPVIPRFDGK